MSHAHVKTFPVNLLIEGKSCLVVGGGRGAAKKIDTLLRAAAAVTVVSPRLSDQVDRWLQEGKIQWIDRPYEIGDLEGRLLVYCATSDRDLNRKILGQCREKGILCCPIDRNWPEGDFVTPATFRQDGLSISISSGGASCRRSRLVKQSLSRHVDMIDSADLLLIGTSHLHLPLDRRESFHLAGEQLDRIGRMLRHVWGVHEFLILNTCNRVEVLAVVSDDASVNALVQRILGFDSLAEGEFYSLRGWDAFSHSCTLLAGLFSQTPGENHIVAQVKEAYRTARELDWTGVVMEDWISRALGVSKKIRRGTDPLLKEVEIEDVTVEYLVRGLSEYQGITRAMVIGTGIVGKGVVEKFLEQGIPVIWCYHRFIPELDEAMEDRVELCPLEEMSGKIRDCDCVVAATGSSSYLLDASHGPYFPPEKTILLADLSLPRNISPELERSDGSIRVVDLDDLKHWFRRSVADMERIMELNKSLIEENRGNYERISASLQSRNP